MLVTKITIPAFEDIIVIGKISNKDKEQIKKVKGTMAFGEYAGYSPEEQEKYKAIIKILEKYKRPATILYI